MKAIINGKMYNTDTATFIGSDAYSHPGNFRHWYEALYRKMNGEFFLYGEGGPLSHYREQVDTTRWSSGSKITPFSLAEAKKWAETHINVDKYIETFGEVDE